MKKIFTSLTLFVLFLLVATPSFADFETFTASDVVFDPSTGSLSLNYSDQDLSACNALAMLPPESLGGNGDLFYDSGGPAHYITCDSSTMQGMLGEDMNVGNFTSTSTYSFLVRSGGVWYHSQPIPNPFFVPTPPVTEVGFSYGFPDGSYRNPVTITLTAKATSGDTIANTYYTVDGGSQEVYSSPFTITGTGSHTLTYWSVDASNREEEPNVLPLTLSDSHTITGTVYVDTNENGVQDSGEVGYTGASIYLTTQRRPKVTNSSGNYTFSNIQDADYTATLNLPAGYTATTPNPVDFTLSTNTTQSFGIIPE